MSEPCRVAVIGGGISGLAAAFELAGARDKGGLLLDIVLVEAGRSLGGKIQTTQFARRQVDMGPDAFIARRPEAIRLCRELGIEEELTHPATTGASVYARGKLRELPDGLALGVPTKLAPLARSRILGARGLARASVDLLRVAPTRTKQRTAKPGALQVSAGGPGPAPANLSIGADRSAGADRSIGEMISRRMGSQVVDLLADPLIGGIHAASVKEMSSAAVFPALLDAYGGGGSLMRALRPRPALDPPSSGPPASPESPEPPPAVFATMRSGLGYLVDQLHETVASMGVAVRTSSEVTAVERSDGCWTLRLSCGVPTSEETLRVDAVVLAVPPWQAARVLSADGAGEGSGQIPGGPQTASPWSHARASGDPVGTCQSMAALLGQIRWSDVALVTLELDEAAFEKADARRGYPLRGTGFLVPANSGTLMTACTWLDAKWAHLRRPSTRLVRISAGRHEDRRQAELDDDDLVERLLGDLDRLTGISTEPRAQMVKRWPRAFPHYRVGHLDLVKEIRARARSLPYVTLAGAAYGGVGIPACIGSGREAARELLVMLSEKVAGT